jgi:hypothetical protein
LWCGLLPWGAALDVVKAEAALPTMATVALFVMQKEMFADIYDLEGDVAARVPYR